ncbi:MAG: alpha/beta hydrolase [bacterium]|nr:alpha/beta hydrolase [bacterium]
MFRILISIAVVSFAWPISAEAPADLPRFEPTSCASFDLPEENVECGFLIVPENRADPGERTLRLAVANLKSRSANPEPDPVIYLHGGPGGSAISSGSRWLDHPLRDDRDFILLDQRGVGYSEPKPCPQLSHEDMMVVARDLSGGKAMAERLALSLACRDTLLEEGFDLGSYHSDASSADLTDLRRVLGLDTWNLYGISYGTKLALSTLRNAPEGIRSVVLDSTYPPGIQSFDHRTLNLVRALKVLFEACASDPACATAYPDPKETFFAALEDLQGNPLTVPIDSGGPLPIEEFTINGQDFLIAAHQMLYRRPMIALIPFTLEAMRTRNLEALHGLIDSFGERASGINRATYNMVECYERGPFGSLEAYEELTADHPRLRDSFTYFAVDQQICDVWAEDHAGSEEALPVSSDIPSLILAGDFDPITPPEWGVRAAQTLEKNFFLQFPGIGHGASVSHPCPEAITVAFVRDPTREPDASCMAEMKPLPFVTDLHVNSGVYRLSKALLIKRDTGAAIAWAAVALALLSGALWVPLAALIGRIRRRTEQQERGGTAALWMATSACMLALVFLLGLGATLLITADHNPVILAFGVPGWAAPLFLLPILIALTIAGALLLTPSAWRSSWWSLWRKLLHTVSILGCAGFLALLARFGIF